MFRVYTKEFIAIGLSICGDLISWCNSNLQKYKPHTPQYKIWDTRLTLLREEANSLSEKYIHATREKSYSNYNERKVANAET